MARPGIVAVDPVSGTSKPFLGCVSGCSSSGSLAASPTGASIAYGVLAGGEESIGIVEVATGRSRVIAACLPAHPCAAGYSSNLSWSPDGRWIAVDTIAGIWTLGIDGQPAALIATAGRDPTFSPDGSRIMYLTATGVQTMAVDGTDRQFLGFRDAMWAAWSPAGPRIAYITDVLRPTPPGGDPYTAQLWVADLDGRRAQKIDEFPGCCIGAWIGPPVWSPDGRWLAVAGGTGASRLTIVEPDASPEVAVGVAIDTAVRAVPTWFVRPAPTGAEGTDPNP